MTRCRLASPNPPPRVSVQISSSFTIRQRFEHKSLFSRGKLGRNRDERSRDSSKKTSSLLCLGRCYRSGSCWRGMGFVIALSQARRGSHPSCKFRQGARTALNVSRWLFCKRRSYHETGADTTT